MPSFGASPFCTTRMPFMPVSVEPIASVITRYRAAAPAAAPSPSARRSPRCCRTRRATRRRPRPAGVSSVSASGRAIASPVTCITLTPLLLDRAPHLFGVEARRYMTAVLPSKSMRYIANCPAPCMSGGMDDRRRARSAATGRSSRSRPSGAVTRSLVNTSMPPPSAKYTSSWRHITPLGMPVVPPGVEQVDVVVGALGEVALGRARPRSRPRTRSGRARRRRRRSRSTRCARSAAAAAARHAPRRRAARTRAGRRTPTMSEFSNR